MKLKKLHIQNLPGIVPGFAIENPDPGINLITGPNAAGKSSLIRALQYLVGTSRADDPRTLQLKAEFLDGQDHLCVQRLGRDIQWERNGQLIERPALPGPEHLHCYWLSMEQLIGAHENDEHLLAELRRSMSGGFDLVRLRRAQNAQVRPRAGQQEARALNEHERHIRQIEAQYAALHHEEQRLPLLDRYIEQGRQAQQRIAALEIAHQWRETHRQLQATKHELSLLPTGMERLRGDEGQRLDKLRERQRELEHDLRQARQSAEQAHAELQRTGLEQQRPESSHLRTCQRQVQELHLLEQQRAKLSQEYTHIQAELQQARRALGAPEDSCLPPIGPETIEQANALCDKIQAKKRECENLQFQIEDDTEIPGNEDQNRAYQAAHALRRWLAAAAIPGAAVSLLAAVAATAALGVVANLLLGAWLAAIPAGLATIGSIIGLVQLRSIRSQRLRAQQEYQRSGQPQPEHWQREAVETSLQQSDEHCASINQRLQQASRSSAFRAQLDSAHKHLEMLEQESREFALQQGLDPHLCASAQAYLAHLIGASRDAQARLQACTEDIARLDEQIAGIQSAAAEFIHRWHPQADTRSIAALESELEDIQQRLEQARHFAQKLEAAQREIRRLENDCQSCRDEQRELLSTLGLNADQEPELYRRLEQLPEWQRLQQQWRERQTLEADKRSVLEKSPDILALAEQADDAELHQQIAEARDQAEQLEKHLDERTSIRTRLDEAGADRQLEKALANRHSTLAALEDEYRKTQHAHCAQFLLDSVEAEYKREHEPSVLRQARERFQRFTHFAFDIELGEDGSIGAHDLQQNASRTLEQLSTGTRMQLLLATRLGWAVHLEQGQPGLPLFLDEALTTSDEHRFAQIIENLEQIVEHEDRQLFYLSARQQDIALWQHLSGTCPHHIDLAHLRSGAAHTEPLDIPEAPGNLNDLPSPQGMDAVQYAHAIGLGKFNPRDPATGLPLLHVLHDDLPLLYHLMEDWRIFSLAQLETLLHSPAAAQAIGQLQQRQKLLQRCRAARVWIDAWQLGRGTPVDRDALERSGAISENFIEEVSDLATQLNGDGQAIVTALLDGQVHRFRRNRAEDLHNWLLEQGYIDHREPLGADDRQRAVLMQVADEQSVQDVRQLIAWLESAGAGTHA